MDINSLLKGALPSFTANMTSGGYNMSGKGLPDGMATLLPLLGTRANPLVHMVVVLWDMLGSRTGLDPTVLLTLFGFFWAINKVWRQIYTQIFGLVQTYFMANVHVSGNDEIYTHIMRWLAQQPGMANSRSLMAETVGRTAWEDEDESDVLKTRISADGTGVYLNFSNQEAKAPPRFVPAMGLHSFWHDGTYFRLHRKQETFLEDSNPAGGAQTLKDKEHIVISCYGWSPDPIKRLLQHTKELYYTGHHARTIVRRPSPQNVRRYGGRGFWVQVANRPIRPMKTVVLDAKQKLQLLADINEYLHPATPRWYANRGIPLRRGYLFHGPPGSGKTSLSFALAGVFGLDIYVVSLLEPSLTEEDLCVLFNTLPRRCVVLLEDIDTAGLSRPADEIAGSKQPTKGDVNSPNEWKVVDLARALKTEGKGNEEKKGISLSGLLNAIDGVASHEGRVLIMTTNKPESLDEALIRPGRVDLQVGFTNATRAQAAELFERMYEADKSHRRATTAVQPDTAAATTTTTTPDTTAEKPPQEDAANGAVAADGRPTEPTPPASSDEDEDEDDEDDEDDDSCATPTPPTSTAAELAHDERLDMTASELRSIARAFAAKVPDGAFSPAEIQGFLLKRKKNPRRALAEADKWIAAMLEQKASKTKILQVQ